MTVPAFTHPLTARIAGFLHEIGVEVRARELPGDSFLPGILIERGCVVIDEARLPHPGDLLHEAGHLAMMTPESRAACSGDVGAELGEEIGAIAWSYAAALHLEIDPAAVFHPDGYRGASGDLLESFRAGRYVGVSLLQWMGLALEPGRAREQGLAPYPHMLKWLRE